jgi:hypothetical protein
MQEKLDLETPDAAKLGKAEQGEVAEIPLAVLDMICGGGEDSRFGAGSWHMSLG